MEQKQRNLGALELWKAFVLWVLERVYSSKLHFSPYS